MHAEFVLLTALCPDHFSAVHSMCISGLYICIYNVTLSEGAGWEGLMYAELVLLTALCPDLFLAVHSMCFDPV